MRIISVADSCGKKQVFLHERALHELCCLYKLAPLIVTEGILFTDSVILPEVRNTLSVLTLECEKQSG